MDLIASLVVAITLALGAAGAEPTTPSDTTEAGSNNSASGTTTSSETEPSDTTEARSHIIDLG